MTLLAGFGGLLVKEGKELLREKRLATILLILGLIITLPFTFFLRSVFAHGGGYTPGVDDVVQPLAFILPIALVIASITFAADSVSKEKDSGMLGLLLSSPVTTEGFLAAKVAGTFLAFGAVAAFTLAFTAILAPAWGWTLMKIVLWFFLIPFLALWIFLVGLSLLVSVVMNSSKTAMAAAVGVYLPLFLLLPPFLGELLRMVWPSSYEYLEYNPIWVAVGIANEIAYGAPFRWVPVFTTVGAGIVLLGIAYLLLRRQEVPG